jgi:hypothetical protein
VSTAPQINSMAIAMTVTLPPKMYVTMVAELVAHPGHMFAK